MPIAAGSVTDVMVRAAAPMLSQRLGQPVIVDNRPGASGIVGAEACAKAAADGYTVCAVYHSIMSFNPFMFDKLPYDPERDFAPIGKLFFVTEGPGGTGGLAGAKRGRAEGLCAEPPERREHRHLGRGLAARAVRGLAQPRMEDADRRHSLTRVVARSPMR